MAGSHLVCGIVMASDLTYVTIAKNTLLNGVSPRFQYQSWTELQIQGKDMSIIGHFMLQAALPSVSSVFSKMKGFFKRHAFGVHSS